MVTAVITLLGVGHVFDLNAQVRREILRRGPAVVGLELDPRRFQALSHPERQGGGPVIYRLLAYFQQNLAEGFGGRAGDEMLAAAGAARDIGARLAFIDMDSSHLLQRLWGSLPFEERIKILVAAVSGLFARRTTVEKEIARYEEDQGAYLGEFGRQFPTVKHVLIDERDEHMAVTLRQLVTEFGSVVAVIGDGHVDGIRARLADLTPEVVRLKELRHDAPSTAEFSFSVQSRP